MPTMKRPMMSISNDPAFSPRAINRAEITANTLLASRVPFLQGETEKERQRQRERMRVNVYVQHLFPFMFENEPKSGSGLCKCWTVNIQMEYIHPSVIRQMTGRRHGNLSPSASLFTYAYKSSCLYVFLNTYLYISVCQSPGQQTPVE